MLGGSVRSLLVLVISALLLAGSASAHISYVLSDGDMQGVSSQEILAFFLKPFQTPLDLVYILLVPSALVLLVYLFKITPVLRSNLGQWRRRTRRYYELIPWILRLSAGIALIGYGTTGHLLTPGIFAPQLGWIQVLLGFMLLLGFLTRAAALTVAGLYLSALGSAPSLLGGLEILGAAATLFVTGSGKPSLDDILGVTLIKHFKRFHTALHKAHHLVPFLMRVTLGATFVWLGVTEKFLNPALAALVVEKYDLTGIVPVSANLWVLGAGAIEVLLGGLLIMGLWVRPVGVVAFAVITATFFFFGESVIPHVTIFGVLSALVITGGSTFSLDQYFKKQD